MPLYPSDTKPPGLIGTLIGLAVEPGTTTAVLLRQPRPPHAFVLFLLMIVVVFLPISIRAGQQEIFVYSLTDVLNLAAIAAMAIITFILLETILLIIVGAPVAATHMAAAMIYSLTPFVFVTLVFYILALFYVGDLSFIDALLLRGEIRAGPFSAAIPYAFILCELISVVIFYHCIRSLGEMGIMSAFLVLLLSLVPAYAATRLAFYVGELIRPGTKAQVIQLLNSDLLHTVLKGAAEPFKFFATFY